MSELPAPTMAQPEIPASTKINDEMLARMGDDGAQRRLDMAHYMESTPSTADEVVDVPKPHEMVETAIEDATDEHGVKGYKQLIEELNNTRLAHNEKMQVLTKDGKVVTRSKKVEADPTKTDDLFDALAGKLASTELTDDGLLTVLGQMDKKLQLNGDEVSALIDKIHAARSQKSEVVNPVAVDALPANNEAGENPAEQQAPAFAPPKAEDEAKPRELAGPTSEQDRVVRSYVNAEGKPLVGFDELNNELARKVAAGDDSDWDNLVATLRDAVENDAKLANAEGSTRDSGSVEDHLSTFEKYASDKYQELQANKNGGRVDVPPIDEQTPHDAVEAVEQKGKSRRWKRAAVAVLAAVGILGGATLLSRSGDSDSGVHTDKTEQTTPEVDRGHDTANSSTDEVDNPLQPAGGEIGEADSGQADYTFTVEVPYSEGAPTAWSWAESLGVTDIPGFLKEVMGDDWRDIARHMKIGDSISVSKAEVEQFTKK